MKLDEALKLKGSEMRVTCGYRWMLFSSFDVQWIVYEHTPRQKNTKIVIMTKDESEAVTALIMGA